MPPCFGYLSAPLYCRPSQESLGCLSVLPPAICASVFAYLFPRFSFLAGKRFQSLWEPQRVKKFTSSILTDLAAKISKDEGRNDYTTYVPQIFSGAWKSPKLLNRNRIVSSTVEMLIFRNPWNWTKSDQFLPSGQSSCRYFPNQTERKIWRSTLNCWSGFWNTLNKPDFPLACSIRQSSSTGWWWKRVVSTTGLYCISGGFHVTALYSFDPTKRIFYPHSPILGCAFCLSVKCSTFCRPTDCRP